MIVEKRLEEMGLVLPGPVQAPLGVQMPFALARRHRDRVYLSGHTPLHPDGTVAGPFGQVGGKIKHSQAYEVARRATLSLLASLKREIHDLDGVDAWLRIDGYVLTAPGFSRMTQVVNGCSDLLIALYGADRACHARTALGVASTPYDCPVILAAEVALAGGS